MGQIAKAAAATAPQARQQDGIKGLLAANWDRIQAVMPRHMSSGRLYQLALSAINTTPKLAQCDGASILSCVMKCSALGLEPSAVDGLGRAYILPYRSKTGMHAQMILGYKGMIDLARRSGQVKDISARAVYEGDEFEYSFGLEETLRHVPSGKVRAKGELPTHVYMVCHFTDGGHYVDVMSRAEVEAVRARSKAASTGPWVTDYEAMAKKSVIRRAFPYLPVSIQAQSAASSDETSGGFAEQLTEGVPAIAAPEPEQIVPERRDSEPRGLRSAVCRSCGTQFEAVAEDDLGQLNASAACCAEPDYAWKEQ